MSGTIRPVLDLSGTFSVLDGTVSDSSSQDWLLVQVELDSGSADVDQIQASVVGVEPVLGAAGFDDPGETPTGGSVSNTQTLFDYDHTNLGSPGNLEAGEISDRLVASFNEGDLPGPGLPGVHDPGTATFSLSSGTNTASVDGVIVVVPEPATLGLVGGGLLVLALARSRRRPG